MIGIVLEKLGWKKSDRNSIDLSKDVGSARQVGLVDNIVEKKFVVDGKRYIVKGYKPRNHKYPIIAECLSSGKMFKFPKSVVLNNLSG